MATGTVKWFNPAKGYGFIQPEDGGKDVFVHISALERAGISSVTEGQKVEYELAAGRDNRMSATEATSGQLDRRLCPGHSRLVSKVFPDLISGQISFERITTEPSSSKASFSISSRALA